MLEEKNDNLPAENSMADGNTENSATENVITENQEVDTPVVEEATAEVQAEIDAPATETEPTIEDANEFAVNEIANVNAEESEDETLKARHEIPLEDYEAMPMDQLV
ncbi:MAG: hypothetical protein RLZZ231_1325, partial [Bacteroidota bacterium]